MDHRSFIFFFCVMISSDAAPLKNLTASVGGNITLPDAVEEEGILLYQRKMVAMVHNKKLLEIYEERFKKNLHWDQNTGFFTLTCLQKNFSGLYSLDSKKRREFFVDYNLVVYDSVATPKVIVLNSSSENCSLSCSVNPTQDNVTLLWIKDEKILKKKSSAASLSLTLFYHQDQNASVQCVAENPAENKRASGDVWTLCDQNQSRNTSSSILSRHHWLIIIIITLMVCIAIVLLSAVIIWRFCHQKTLTARQTEDVVYTDVNIIRQNRREDVNSPSRCESPEVNTIDDQVATSNRPLKPPASP